METTPLALALACLASSVAAAPAAAHAQRRRTLTAGREVRGNTSSTPNSFRPSCGASHANDESWTFTPRDTATYEIAVSSDHDNVLAVVDPASAGRELGCNDDSTDNRHSFLENTLERGTYFVVVDGFRTGNQGSFTLDVQVQ